MTFTLLITLLIILVLLSGFFSGSETALFSLSGMTVRAYRSAPNRIKRLIARLLKRPRDLLVTILMCNVLVNILVQNVSANIFEQFPGWLLKVGVPLLLTLLFGELIPKSIALPNNRLIAGWVARPITLCHTGLGPLRRAITWITSYLSRFTFFFLRRKPAISRAEMESALHASREEGVLGSQESELLAGYLAFQEATVKELMRPREDIIAYDREDPIEDLEALFVDQECTRVPIFEGDFDKILGIVDAGDYFVMHEEATLEKIWQKPFYAPESMLAHTLLEKFAEKGEALAIVVDEYGSVVGLITREDLVEVVVGEIEDRRDQTALFTRAGEDVLIASGKLEVTDFNEEMGAELTSENSQVTLGGWICEQLGEVPEVGVKFEFQGLFFHILAAEPNRVRRIYVRRMRE